ncbi:IMPACT family protein [Silvimonas soli]|uniref:IMPACT family protein n=1 Tax=Silvimonas soli TaxID=2980100 RepID=UPI0024B33531|nr:YigZ family protein [Silvimonas soli]
MPTYTLAAPVHAELEIKKSRFLGSVLPVADRAAALAIIARTRSEHSAAAHVCWALLAGGESGMSDDGEPSGTAGRPMLSVLQHHHLDGVLGLVVRYYGGIRLGAGGLVRAYTDAIASAIKQAQVVPLTAKVTIEIEIPYADEARVRHWLMQSGHLLTAFSHANLVRLCFITNASDQAIAEENLQNLTQGQVRFLGPAASSR